MTVCTCSIYYIEYVYYIPLPRTYICLLHLLTTIIILPFHLSGNVFFQLQPIANFKNVAAFHNMPRWRKLGKEGKYLRNLFEEHALNPRNGADPNNQTAPYIKNQVYNKYTLFRGWTLRLFYPNYRCLAREFLVDRGREGRRGKC